MSQQRTDTPEPGPVPDSARGPLERDPDGPVSVEPSRAERPGSRPLSATLERLESHTPDEARYELEEDSSPSAVVVNAIRTQITNFF